MDIGDVSKRSGLPPSTLRFYEEKGLISSVGRSGLRRVFASDILERLALIALGRSAGFSLHEIASMLGPDGKPRIDPGLLDKRAAELDESIKRLTAVRDGLRHAAVCSAPSYLECPSFRRLMALAAAGALTVPRTKPTGRRRPARKKRR